MIRPGTQIASVSALSDNIFEGVLDISDLRSVTLHVSGTFDLSLTVEVSNDIGEPSNWIVVAILPNVSSRAVVSAITAPGMYSVPLGYRALRIRCGEYTSGIATVNAVFSKDAPLDAITTDPTFSTRIVESGNYIYIGKAPIGSSTSSAVWQVKRVDTTSGAVILWADGDDGFDNVFDNYATLSYL